MKLFVINGVSGWVVVACPTARSCLESVNVFHLRDHLLCCGWDRVNELGIEALLDFWQTKILYTIVEIRSLWVRVRGGVVQRRWEYV